MIWRLKAPAFGDMIRVKTGGIYHYGIFVSEDEIVQFGLPPAARAAVKDSEVAVCVSDIDAFLTGNFVEVGEAERSERKKLRPADKIVETARSRVGEKGYNLLYNNCEHFVYQCTFGEKYSSQTENIRALFQTLPIVDVYVAEIPEKGKISSVYPPLRNREIRDCANEKVKREKYFVWKLLEYALARTFGLKMKKLDLKKSGSGKWKCGNCEFSLSHSKNAVAVAVSRKPVGVDIEAIEPIKTNRFADKILNEAEKAAFEATNTEEKNQFLIEKWTQKESIFKTLDKSGFLANIPDTLSAKTRTRVLELGGGKYCLSVASENIEKIRFFDKIDLSKV